MRQFANLEIRKDRQIVLYCRSGQRAGIAEAALRQAGYTNLLNGGGYSMLISHLN
ncbi:rhodanese-like domain-containing protein [Motiliproteus sp. MSK22-1]|uniref:rhodanese-like domain-containing protein n=1 Tax=Motiliproteus sp. MSK22-1 TaxID=1897630 RepID=UPI0018E931DC